MLVSIAQKKDLYAYIIMEGDVSLASVTGTLTDKDIVADKYLRTIEIMRRALLQTKQLFEANPDLTNDVIIEIANSTIIKWVEACKVPKKYAEAFAGLMGIINGIPMMYALLHEPHPQALAYVKDYKVKDNDVTGVEALLEGTAE